MKSQTFICILTFPNFTIFFEKSTLSKHWLVLYRGKVTNTKYLQIICLQSLGNFSFLPKIDWCNFINSEYLI